MKIDLNVKDFQELVSDDEKQFMIGYSPSLDEYFLVTIIWQVIIHTRWYPIQKSDCELYLADRESFCEKFQKEISER